jgi:hypothetical protein
VHRQVTDFEMVDHLDQVTAAATSVRAHRPGEFGTGNAQLVDQLLPGRIVEVTDRRTARASDVVPIRNTVRNTLASGRTRPRNNAR